VAKYQRATEMNPSAQTFTRAGAYLRKHGRHADSIPMFRKAAQLKPTAYAYTYWGMAVRDARLPGDEARKLFEKAIAADPKIPNAYNQLGLMYLREEKWADAAKAFGEAIKADPDWSNYYYNLGRALRGAGNLKNAGDAFKRSIELDQSHPRAQAELDGEARPLSAQMFWFKIATGINQPLIITYALGSRSIGKSSRISRFQEMAT